MSPKESSPGTGASRACGGRTWRGKAGSKLDISKGLLLEPSLLPQTPGQGQGVDCHPPVVTEASHCHRPRYYQYWSPAQSVATCCPLGQGSPNACNGPAEDGHHPALQGGHKGTELPKATQRTGGGHGQSSMGPTPKPSSSHHFSQPLLRDTPQSLCLQMPQALTPSIPRPGLTSSWVLLTPTLSQ